MSLITLLTTPIYPATFMGLPDAFLDEQVFHPLSPSKGTGLLWVCFSLCKLFCLCKLEKVRVKLYSLPQFLHLKHLSSHPETLLYHPAMCLHSPNIGLLALGPALALFAIPMQYAACLWHPALALERSATTGKVQNWTFIQ